MRIMCENTQTAAIAEVRAEDVGLVWTLDPDHFSARLAHALSVALSKIACHWRREGTRELPVALAVSRASDLSADLPVMVVDRPGVLAIAMAACEATAAGVAAFERAMAEELTHWYQLAA